MSNTLLLCLFLVSSLSLASSITLTYVIEEELRAEAILGNIGKDANLQDFVSEEEFSRLQYSFLAQSSPYTANFSIDSRTGDLKTTTPLDREIMCNFLDVCKLEFEAVAQSNLGSFFQKIQLEIYVSDINDNAPEFSVPNYLLEISEGSSTGVNFPLLKAVDKDTGLNNSVRSYDLQPKNTPFVLITSVGPSGVLSISLELVQRLDREITPSYNLMVLARDGGMPQRTGTLNLIIKVTDVNDNFPVFGNSVFKKNISETTPPNTVIFYLAATDADIGQNGNVTFHFQPRQPESVLSLFHLNTITGELMTAGSLEHEAGKTHKLIIEARDAGTQSKSAEATVDVTILDTHNDPPEIRISVFHPSGVAHISEYSEIGRVVAHIAVTDPDSDANGRVQCSISNSSFELRELDKNEFKVILVKLLDRETIEYLNVMVTCKDGGSPPIEVHDQLRVKVVDENDRSPKFEEDGYYVTIPENNDIGVSVTRVSATDDDKGKNAKITYRLIDDPKHRFDITSNGTLLAAMRYDREQTPQIVAKVIAVDGGEPANTATATVVMTVQDRNDQRPVFTNATFHLSVPEDSSPYTSVGQVNATDADIDENAIIMYQLYHSVDIDLPFVVYADGVIKTNRVLDREEKRVYEFSVVATDLGRPALNSTARVKVTVKDVNDHTPVILFPNPRNNTVPMPHNLQIDSYVTKVDAFDEDEKENAEIFFYIEGGNGSGVFHMEESTGILRLKKDVHKTHISDIYSLMIVAKDQGIPSRANQAELFIEVVRGNSTSSFSNQASINIITAMVLVGVTILLAVIVIATICLLRSSDKKRRLYHAKAEEEKVISNMKRYGSSVSSSSKNSTTPLSDKDSDKKEKEVSFSLDEENNVSMSSGGSVGFNNARNADNLFTIPEDSENPHKKKNHGKQTKQFTTFKDDPDKGHTHIRFHDDSGSDMSGDVSISDSGRGGSDVELQSHGGSSNVLEDSYPRHPKSHDHQSASPVASFSTFYGSDAHGTSYDNSSLSDSIPMKQFPDNHLHNGAIPYRTGGPNSSLPPHRLSVPQKHRNNHNQGLPQRMNYGSHRQYYNPNRSGDGGTYVHLKHGPVEGEYMDMNGHKVPRKGYCDDTVSDMNTSTWDNDTTTSGSYTVDPDELCDEIDRLFFKQNINKDVIV